jgi:hypothetical protein
MEPGVDPCGISSCPNLDMICVNELATAASAMPSFDGAVAQLDRAPAANSLRLESQKLSLMPTDGQE